MIDKLIEDRIDYTFHKKPKNRGIPNKYTLKNSQLPLDFLNNYDFIDRKDEYFRINSFSQINFPDPYPQENTFQSKCKVPVSKDDNVYI